MRFSDTLLAEDPEYLKHENILPVLLYNIRAALNHTVYIWESKRPEQNVYHFRGCHISSSMVNFFFFVF